MNLPITLLYHAVLPRPANPDAEERRLFVHPDLFAEQMDILAKRGYRTLKLSEYASGLQTGRFPERSFLLTFDDGYLHVPEAVSPVLRRHGYSAVMFIPTAHIGSKNAWDADHQNLAALELLDAADLCVLNKKMWEIASHGSRHVDLTRMQPTARLSDLTEAREYLSDLLGDPVLDLAYPYGMEDEKVRADTRRAGYRLAFMAGHSRSMDPYRLPRRPIRGDLGIQAFRLITSAVAGPLYRIKALSPRRTRTTIRAVGQ